MNTTDNKYSMIKGNKVFGNQNKTDRSTLMNEELYDVDDIKESDNNTSEIAQRGYTVRNGYNPNKPNPDQIINEDDLNDDFHSEKDLKHDSEDLYQEELDLNGKNVSDVNDEFDNPSDVLEDDFNETEDDLEDIDQDDEEDEEDEEDDEYIEDDVQEEKDNDDYPDNDPRKF
ncbi:hypothetical protein [Flavobacterium sp. ov086]|uniref:hypothetical protein n=1 Tax=Flavobacterium sp. ov086 TaxID=1761785 RepID=UPI000B7452A1|nr:hypothetical protein [Flavobacterium sp. ov086]SNR37834.1 hypothetical protein SAMN04487979_104176 [Flavobacterium sp. ov086]